MIKAVIFDMGGVILRTVDQSKRDAMAEQLGTTRHEIEKALFFSSSSDQAEIGAISDVEHWQTVLKHFHQPPEIYEQMHQDFFSGDAIDLDIIAYIRSLKKYYKVGLLSNAWTDAREKLTQMHDFLGVFDVSIFSAEVGLRKPDARIYNLILEKLGVKPQESIFVDDFSENVRAAAQLGIWAVHYQDRQQAIQETNRLLEK